MEMQKYVEKLSSEAELEQERAEIMKRFLEAFAMGVSFITLRVCIAWRHTRLLGDESTDQATVFNADKLIAQLKDQCAAHEASAGFPEAERYVEKDAALIFPAVLTHHLAKLHMVNFSRARVVDQVRNAQGITDDAVERFVAIYDDVMASIKAGQERARKADTKRSVSAPGAPPPGAESAGGHAPAAPAAAASPPLPFTVVDDGIELEESEGNQFHLCVILRKYTAAKMAMRAGRRVTKVENQLLWDALGLLRSLRYDVDSFNAALPTAGEPPRTRDEVRYLCYRLMRQASAFGVRLPKAGEGTASVPGLDALIAHIEGVTFPDELGVARATVRSGLVDFGSLAEMFIPGSDLVDHGASTGLFGVALACRIRACYYSRGKSLFGVVSTFFAACEFVVSVGDKFAVVESHQPIPEFQGTRSITEGFESFIVLSEALKARLTARGDQYCKVATGHAYVEHRPGAFLPAPRGKLATNAAASAYASSAVSKARIGGRMMVDVKAAWERGVHCARTGGEACEAVVGTLKLVAQRQRATGGVRSMEHYGAGVGGAANADESSLELLLLTDLPPRLLWLTWPVVAGFSFAAKAWGVALVDGLRDATFNDRAFEQLVLPPSRKRLIEALVLSHGDAGRATADLIAGKGEGSIFLLHGPPGVGKTLTAEAIAELLHKPLYTVSMGELGTTPESLEGNLQDILDLCVPWGALVLIDEAEMLLERRTKSDIVRNAMVCVMLRLLEYHTGVLFLTSNRVESLDPAFQSRVQCALRYDALDAAARRQVWTTLLAARGYDATARDGEAAAALDLDALAAHPLNGRQIKNALQLALALARRDGAPLSQSHLDATLELSTAFAEAVGGAGHEP